MIYEISLKLTNACNLACKHCYDIKSSIFPINMDKDTLEQSLIYIQLLAKNNIHNKYIVQLIGGEILLAGLEKLYYVFYKLQQYNNIEIVIYTNLNYDLTSKHIELFKKSKLHGFMQPHIKTSWDYNIRFKNNYQEQRFFKNIRYLSDNNIETLTTITLTNIFIKNINPMFIIKKFLNNGCKYISFEHLLITEKNTQFIAQNNDEDNWLILAYEIWKKFFYNKIKINEFFELENIIFNKKQYIPCNEVNDTYQTINTNGSIALRKVVNNNVIGNVKDGINKNLLQKYKTCKCIFTYFCSVCEFYKKYCNGACILFNNGNECTGHKKLILKILNEVSKNR